MRAFHSILAVMMALMLSVGCNTAGDDIAQLAFTESATHIVVDFKDNVGPQEVAFLEDELGIDVVPNSDMYSKTKITVLKIDDSNRYRLDEIVDELLDTDLIETVEVEHTYGLPENELGNFAVAGEPLWFGYGYYADSYSFETPNDPLYQEGKQWNMTMIGVEKAWETTQGDDVVVAVLDTGISTGKGKYPRVPDLRQTCMVEGRNFTKDGAKDDPYDYNGHGTHVAGTIAQSTNNGIGVVGIAHKACVMPVKVLSDRGYGSTADIAEAIVWATDHGANVINMSLGGGGYSKVMDKALHYAAKNNVFVACAAGNNGVARIEYPAAMSGCRAVSSVGKSGELAFYSSYGKNGDGVFIAAPGGDQRADGQEGGVWQNTVVSGNPNQHGYFPFQGTSMATPHVAGVAALVISELPEKYKLRQVDEALSSTATERDDHVKYGNGLLNAAKAVQVASEMEVAEDDEPSWYHWVLVLLIGAAAFRSVRILKRR